MRICCQESVDKFETTQASPRINGEVVPGAVVIRGDQLHTSRRTRLKAWPGEPCSRDFRHQRITPLLSKYSDMMFRVPVTRRQQALLMLLCEDVQGLGGVSAEDQGEGFLYDVAFPQSQLAVEGGQCATVRKASEG